MTDVLMQIRVLIADLDSANYLLSDDLLNTMLGMHGGNLFTEVAPEVVYLTAATALDTIATSETLLGKKITTQDLSTDGVAVGESLRKLAATYRARAAEFTETSFWGYVGGPSTRNEGEERAYS